MNKTKYLICLLPLLIFGCSSNIDNNDDLTNKDDNGNDDHTNHGPGDNNNNNGNNNSSFSGEYSANTVYTSDTEIDNLVINSTGTDENAILIKNNANVKLNSPTLSRISDDSTGGDNSSFYGVGAVCLTYSGTTMIKNGTISSNSKGGAGVFSYGDGISYIKDTSITTKLSTSGGVHVAGGGTLYGYNLNVETNGESSAAIRSDRGSGTMVIDSGTYVSNGTGSPAIYSTADITVNNATLKATSSEAICIEGRNSIELFDSTLEGNMQDSSQNDTTWNVIVYQSMSGDSDIGKGEFKMVGGKLISNNGGMFYTTNTQSDFLLDGVDIEYCDDSEFLLQVTGNTNERGWGTKGENGADCNFTCKNQELEGMIIYDSISSLDMYLLSSSSWNGYMVDDESYTSSKGNGEVSLFIDETSKWIVTNDTELSNLYLEGSIVDKSNKEVPIYDTNGNLLKSGTSSLKITVSSFSSSVDISDAIETPLYSKIEEPSYFN